MKELFSTYLSSQQMEVLCWSGRINNVHVHIPWGGANIKTLIAQLDKQCSITFIETSSQGN